MGVGVRGGGQFREVGSLIPLMGLRFRERLVSFVGTWGLFCGGCFRVEELTVCGGLSMDGVFLAGRLAKVCDEVVTRTFGRGLGVSGWLVGSWRCLIRRWYAPRRTLAFVPLRGGQSLNVGGWSPEQLWQKGEQRCLPSPSVVMSAQQFSQRAM